MAPSGFALSALLFFALPVLGIPFGSTTPIHKDFTVIRSPSNNTARASTVSSDGWSLSSKLEGQTFLDFFEYELSTNDNGGIARYVNGATAGLAYTSGSQVILAVDDTPSASLRKAVRMHSKTRFNAKDNNLFIFDVAHIPRFAARGPRLGSREPTGPAMVSRDTHQRRLLTLVPAASPTSPPPPRPGAQQRGRGRLRARVRHSRDQDVVLERGERARRYTDITNLAPNPSTWGLGRLSVPSSGCSPGTDFKDMLLVVNTNLAGSWPQGVWSSNGVGGQAQSCQTQTGVSTAAGYVTAHDSAFGAAAQWPVRHVIGTYDGTTNFSPACADITRACLQEDGTSIWSHATCVAAATCRGVYASIVGSCAPSCPITQQNYIDVVCGAMTAAGVTSWPRFALLFTRHCARPIFRAAASTTSWRTDGTPSSSGLPSVPAQYLTKTLITGCTTRIRDQAMPLAGGLVFARAVSVLEPSRYSEHGKQATDYKELAGSFGIWKIRPRPTDTLGSDRGGLGYYNALCQGQDLDTGAGAVPLGRRRDQPRRGSVHAHTKGGWPHSNETPKH
ncbi:hypothetical protein DFH09DRAFT_1103299 [Mycena vulgaris]|nr:hypothetical protein DFH09DRAFT_1103299 [Mycena vulgaris]